MPRKCTICQHKRREQIDSALVRGDPNRRIAAQFRVTENAIRRHKARHLPDSLVKAQQVSEVARATTIVLELERHIQLANLLLRACDEWLRDPKDRNSYDINPRSEDINVTYTTPGPRGRLVRRKARLSWLLKKIQPKIGESVEFEMVETKHADPRELLLKTIDRLKAYGELMLELEGRLKRNPEVNLVLSPEFVALRSKIKRALEPYPEAGLAVAEALDVKP